MDREGREMPIRTDIWHPIEIVIPRDPNLMIPPMVLENITSMVHSQSFNSHHVNITSILSISVHFQIDPLNNNLSYLLIYQFDQSNPRIDGWTLLCPDKLTNEGIYRYLINNEDTFGHRTVSFGLRELNSTEMNHFCYNSSINMPPLWSTIEFILHRITNFVCMHLVVTISTKRINGNPIE